MTIKENEKNGLEIEDKLLEKLHPVIHAQKPEQKTCYDIITDLHLIEVKSSNSFHKNGFTRYGKQQFCQGRFILIKNSHESIKTESDKQNKNPMYIFVITDNENNIKQLKWIQWKIVDQLLKNHKPLNRKDGTLLYRIPITRIFTDIKRYNRK